MNSTTIQEQVSSVINQERDDAVVKLSKVIADISSAKQNRTINQKHFDDFKNAFIRLTNLTLYNDSLSKLKYKKSDKLLVDIIEEVRKMEITKKNVDIHVDVAYFYIQQLFKSGVIVA